MRKRAKIALGIATFASVFAVTPGASAEPDPPGCPKGYFCAYSGPDQTGRLVLKTASNWKGNVAARSFFNNGVAFPGADHTYHAGYGSGNIIFTRCLHYNPGPGQYKFNSGDPFHLTEMRWGGECPTF
jgi:hypothetical protein